jgi:hypothetical protein
MSSGAESRTAPAPGGVGVPGLRASPSGHGKELLVAGDIGVLAVGLRSDDRHVGAQWDVAIRERIESVGQYDDGRGAGGSRSSEIWRILLVAFGPVLALVGVAVLLAFVDFGLSRDMSAVVGVTGVLVLIVGWRYLGERRKGLRPGRRPPRLLVNHSFVPGASVTFEARLRRGSLFRTYFPAVRLIADRYYVLLEGRRRRPIWIPRAHVVAVRPVAVGLSTAIHFKAPYGAFDGVILFLPQTDQALWALRQFGWPVVPH